MDKIKKEQLIKLLKLCLTTDDLEIIKAVIESVVESLEEND